MRVGHLNAKGDALVAEFAFSHVAYLLAMKIALKSLDRYHSRKWPKKQAFFEEKCNFFCVLSDVSNPGYMSVRVETMEELLESRV